MKLRFHQNSLRLRLNRREVEHLSVGSALTESVDFPSDSRFAYVLESAPSGPPKAEFNAGTIRISVPLVQLQNWADGSEIGIYFDLPANGKLLKVAIEKDLECIEGPPEERDPEAYPRSGKNAD